MIKNWFLYRVYKFNKQLFTFFVLFLAGTIFTNLLGWQATPFFVWGMFSEKENSRTTYPLIKITVNDNSVINYTKLYTDANKFFLTSPLQQYIFMKKNNGEDPTANFLQKKLGGNYKLIEKAAIKVLNGSKEYHLFFSWYKRYMEQTTGIEINNYKIEVLQTRFSDKNKIEVYSTELIDTWSR